MSKCICARVLPEPSAPLSSLYYRCPFVAAGGNNCYRFTGIITRSSGVESASKVLSKVCWEERQTLCN